MTQLASVFELGRHSRRSAVGVGLLAMLLALGCRATKTATPIPGPLQQAGGANPAPIQPPIASTRPATAPASEQIIVLGESVMGRTIEMYVFGDGGETTLILGGIHGNEFTSHEVAIELIRHLAEHPEAYAGRCVMIAPAVNPDGLASRKRGNARGVDINRNFPAANFPQAPSARFAGGREPLSEPETHAILAAIEHAHPAKIISMHSIPRGRHGNNFDGPALSLAQEMSRYNNYRVLPTMGYVTPGSLGSWAGVDHGIATITLEFPRDADGATCWAENREALLAAIRLPMSVSVLAEPPVPVEQPLLGK